MKLTLMRGLPASGKSTEAKRLMGVAGNTVRVNRDLLRTMLHFDKWTDKNERATKDAAKALAILFLKDGKNVIIDDTNLNPKVVEGWRVVAQATGARFEIVDMSTSVMECILRDSQRENGVGSTVIKNMALQSGLVDPTSIVICDIDGTIANIDHRLHWVRHECEECKLNGEGSCDWKKDWKSFFANLDKDTVRQDVREILVDLYNRGHMIIFVSGRSDDHRDRTLEWFDKNFLSFAFTLIMRRSGDKRPDTEVKQDILNTYFKDRSKIKCVIDDRPSVIRMWQSNGLEVIDVGNGIEF